MAKKFSFPPVFFLKTGTGLFQFLQRHGLLVSFMAIFGVSLALRLPLYRTVYWRTPDAVEYLNVARNMVEGKGLVRSIKWHFFDNHPVVSSAFTNRPIGTSVVLAGLLTVNPDPYFLQLSWLILSAVNAGLFFLVARRFLRQRTAFLMALLVSLSPNMLISSRLLLSETLMATVVYLFFISRRLLVSGFLVGLAFWVRSESLVLLLPILLGMGCKSKRKLFFSGLVIFLIILPFFGANFLVNGSPLYSYNGYHFGVLKFDQGFSLQTNWEPPMVFVSQNLFLILGKILTVFGYSLRNLFNLASLGITVVFLIGSTRYWRKFWPFFYFSIATIFAYSLMWSAIFEAERHFVLVFSLLLIPIGYFLERKVPWKLTLIAVFVNLVVFGGYDVHRINWARNVDTKIDNWDERKKGAAFDWIRRQTKSGDIVAGVDPWLVNLFTKRPTVRLPSDLFEAKPATFEREYRVKYYVVDDPRVAKKLLIDHTMSWNEGEVFVIRSKEIQ